MLEPVVGAVASVFIRRLASRASGLQRHRGAIDAHLRSIVDTFVEGCNLALGQHDYDNLVRKLNSSKVGSYELRGFAFEGAAMTLSLLDLLIPWKRNRLQNFIEHTARQHIYMMYIGLGWALARLRRPIGSVLRTIDPILGWLVVDGYGFHHGFFYTKRYVLEQKLPPRLSGYALRVFDQGVGRSLWFFHRGDIASIHGTILSFAAHRRSDLWSGVGLACAYAGSVNVDAVVLLRSMASGFQPELAQGAAFAAKARQRANIPARHTQIACKVLCGVSCDEAASITDACLDGLPTAAWGPRYELWREAIRRRFS